MRSLFVARTRLRRSSLFEQRTTNNEQRREPKASG